MAGSPGQPPAPSDATCNVPVLPTQPLRRLSSQQYQNTLADLFGIELAAGLAGGSLFPPTIITTGFSNDAAANVVNTSQSNAIEDNAERIGAALVAAPDKYLRALLPCPFSGAIGDAQIDACLDTFIAKFGQRAYRRPLTAKETTVPRRIYDQVRPQGAERAWASVVQFFVQSPALLYRVERGAGPAAEAPGLIKLTDHEMASRLSYLFLNSMPDEPLFSAAAAGQLSTAPQVAAQARRLMQGARFMEALAGFHSDWLRLYELAAGKDAALFADYSAAVQTALLREPLELVRHVLERGDGSLKTLLSGPTYLLNSTLAAHYRVPTANATETQWVPTVVPNRRGLLTQASFMAALAAPNRTSPIHRGAFFRESVMCEDVPALPASVDTGGPLQSTSGLPTARERLAPLMTKADCSVCHRHINPTGLALENYDAVGRWRDKENGATIDASGTIDLGAGAVSFKTPTDFVQVLAASDKVRDCYALHWFRQALGRMEAAEDACGVAALKRQFLQARGDLRELLAALIQTDQFRFRRKVQE